MTYRTFDDLGLDDPALTDDDLLDAAMAHPLLINHPIVVTLHAVKLCCSFEMVLDILPNPQRTTFAKEAGGLVINAAGNQSMRPAA